MSDDRLKRSKLRSLFRRDGKDKDKGKQLAIHGSIRADSSSVDNKVLTAPAGDTGTASAPPSQQPPQSVSGAQVPQESPKNQAKAYAETYDMWKEALELSEETKGCTLNTLLKDWNRDDIKREDLVHEIQNTMDGALKINHHDGTTSIGKILPVLNKFISTVDVAVSFDPTHAALPWAAVRCIIVILTAHDQLKGIIFTGMAEVTLLLVRCDMYQLLYMAPNVILRPPEHTLAKLKTCIVQTYAVLQSFFVFVESQQSSLKIGDVFKLEDARAHIDMLAESQNQLMHAADDCERYCNQSSRSDLKELLGLSSEIPIIRRQGDLLLERIDARDELKLLKWISPIPYGTHHCVIVESRTPDTCEWLLQKEKFREWVNNRSSAVMWLQGSMGIGKTYLTSKVIDHVHSLLESSLDHAGFAFFYCNRNEDNRRDPLCVLQSYVRQLSTPVGSTQFIRKKLKTVSDQAKRQGSHLGFEECITQLTESINEYSETFIILDALDECDPDSRWRLIHVMKDLVSKSNRPLKIFISSRPYDGDIKIEISGNAIEIQAIDNKDDIEKFVNAEIDKPKRWGPIPTDLRAKIVQVLCEDSQGMFQWAYLQIKQLLELSTRADIEIKLGKLPKTLEAAYEEIYAEISKSPRRKALVDRACKWVMSACTPLSSDELLSAVHIDTDQSPIHSDDQLNSLELLDLCSNLLVIDWETRLWRLSHLSVREYFETNNHWDLCEAHSHTAKICLKLLIEVYESLAHEFRTEVLDKTHNIEIPDKMNFAHPLKDYVRHHWVNHVKIYEETIMKEGKTADSFLANLLKRFLGSPNASSSQYRAWFRSLESNTRDYPQSSFLSWVSKHDIAPEDVTICAICRFPFYILLQDWWDNGEITVSQTNDWGDTTLQLAAQAGCRPVCEALIKRSTADHSVFPADFCGGAAIVAASAGNMEIIKFLIDNGANLNLQLSSDGYGGAPGRSGSALAAAALERNIDIANILIENGADIGLSLSKGDFGSALAAAAYGGSIEIVRIFLNAGADVNLQLPQGKYGSALTAAALGRNIGIVNILVQNGADVNLVLSNGQFGSALAAAACGGLIPKAEPVKILIDNGADVNLLLPYGKFGSALAAAAAGGWAERKKIVKVLIDNGGDMNLLLPYGKFGSALAAACSGGWSERTETVKILIENGADVNLLLPYGDFGSALAAAAASRLSERSETVKLLIENGAHVNLILLSGDYGSALAAAALAAAFQRRTETVKILLENGADVNLMLPNGLFGSALAAASFGTSTEIIETLIHNGADVNLKVLGGDFGSALATAASAAASFRKSTEIIKVLIQNGAYVNLTLLCGDYGSALAAAVASDEENIEVVKFLIENGADVNLTLPGGKYGSALAAAVSKGYKDVKNVLLEHGATTKLVSLD